MGMQVTAIYEKGVLRLLTLVALPEKTRVRVQILSDEEPVDDLRRAEAVLVAAGIVRLQGSQPRLKRVSLSRRAELAHLYAAGGPLSEAIIADRETR